MLILYLQMIVLYNELNLIMHPVILQLVKLKWSMFGQKFAIINVLINVFYTIVWTAIAIVAEKKHVTTHYTPMKDHVFKIIVEALGVIMTLVFIIQVSYLRGLKRRLLNTRTKRLLNPLHDAYRTCTKNLLNRYQTLAEPLLNDYRTLICLLTPFIPFLPPHAPKPNPYSTLLRDPK